MCSVMIRNTQGKATPLDLQQASGERPESKPEHSCRRDTLSPSIHGLFRTPWGAREPAVHGSRMERWGSLAWETPVIVRIEKPGQTIGP